MILPVGTSTFRTLSSPDLGRTTTTMATTNTSAMTLVRILLGNGGVLLYFIAGLVLSITKSAEAFQVQSFTRHTLHTKSTHPIELKATSPDSKDQDDKEYRNVATKFLSNFLPDEKDKQYEDPLGDINFDAPKIPKTDINTLARRLDAELYQAEWFVTGRVNPSLFKDDFQFQDPDVKLTGIEEYARGVYKLFDQSTSRAEIISTVVNTTLPNAITVTWRLSGNVNIGPRPLTIKPYIVYTDLVVDSETGLIVFQEDRFDLPGWDILLSALFPFLVDWGILVAPPAPPVEERVAPVFKEESNLENPIESFLGSLFGKRN